MASLLPKRLRCVDGKFLTLQARSVQVDQDALIAGNLQIGSLSEPSKCHVQGAFQSQALVCEEAKVSRGEVTGRLDVGGSMSVGDSLTVVGAATLGHLDVGNVKFRGRLDAESAKLGALTSRSATVHGPLLARSIATQARHSLWSVSSRHPSTIGSECDNGVVLHFRVKGAQRVDASLRRPRELERYRTIATASYAVVPKDPNRFSPIFICENRETGELDVSFATEVVGEHVVSLAIICSYITMNSTTDR